MINDDYIRLVNKIEDRKPFSFSILSYPDVFNALKGASQKLKQVLQSNTIGTDNYMIAIGDTTYSKLAGYFKDNPLFENTVWHDGDIFEKAKGRGKFHHFINALQDRVVIVVGPPEHQSLKDNGMINNMVFVNSETLRTFDLLFEITRLVSDNFDSHPIVLFCGSVVWEKPSFIYLLHNHFKGRIPVSFVDVGNSFG